MFNVNRTANKAGQISEVEMTHCLLKCNNYRDL